MRSKFRPFSVPVLSATLLLATAASARGAALCPDASGPTPKFQSGLKLGDLLQSLRHSGYADLRPTEDELFPRYVQICSGGQLKRVDGGQGGIGGHSFVYLKGACRDRSVRFPKLKMCDQPESVLADPERGVLVSVDSFLKNTQWVAIEGLSLGLTGRDREEGGPKLSWARRITEAKVNELARAAVAQGSFEGVQVHDAAMADKPASLSDQEWMARIFLGTDFAIALARETHCSRIPVTREQTVAMVEELNSSNEPYVSGKKIYEWSGLRDSCAHLSNHVLASAGLADYVPSGTPFTKPLSAWRNLAFPANAVLDAIDSLDFTDVASPEKVFANSRLRGAFDRFGWLPFQAGGTTQHYTVPGDNEVFVGRSFILVKESVPLPLNYYRYHQLPNEEWRSDVKLNLRRTLAHLERAQREMVPLEELTRRDPRLSTRTFAAFYRRYQAWIAAEIVTTREKLAKVRFGVR